MKLQELIKKIDYIELKSCDDLNTEISGISYNSKLAKKGDIFVCLKGEHTDGHKYYKEAELNGVVAFLCEEQLNSDLPQIVVKSTEQTIAIPSAILAGEPSKYLNLIGITGTNGKTTVTHLIQRIFENFAKKTDRENERET